MKDILIFGSIIAVIIVVAASAGGLGAGFTAKPAYDTLASTLQNA